MKVEGDMRKYFNVPLIASIFVLLFWATDSSAHWSGIDLCDKVDGIDYLVAKKILHDEKMLPDIQKSAITHSQYPEFSTFCVKSVPFHCEVTFKEKKGGFVTLNVVKRNDSEGFWVDRCY